MTVHSRKACKKVRATMMLDRIKMLQLRLFL